MPSSLLAVMLVASSADGARIVFAYPPNAQAIPRLQRPLYGKSASVRDAQARSAGSSSSSDSDDGLDVFGSRFIRGEASSGSSSEDDDQDDPAQDDPFAQIQTDKDSYNTYLGMNTGALASLLCPDKALCNKRFELVINHIAYIAHPAASSKRSTLSPTTHTRNLHRNGRRRHRNGGMGQELDSPFTSDGEDAGLSDVDGKVEEDDQDDESEVVHLRSRQRYTRRADASGTDERGRSAPVSAAASRRTSHSVPNRPSNLRASRDSSVGRSPSSFHTPLPSGPSSSAGNDLLSRATSASKSGGRTLPSTLAMSSNYAQDSSFPSQSYSSYHSQQQYNSISAPPASFVPRTDLEKWAVILVIDVPPDQALSSHLGVYYRDVVVPLMAGLKYEERRSRYVTEEVAKISALRDSAVDNGVPLEEHVQELQTKSSLCAQLASLYDGLKKNGLANLTLNDDIDLSVLLHTELFYDIGPQSPSTLQRTHLHGEHSNQLSTRSTYDRQTSALQKRQLAPPYDGNRLDLARLTSRLTAGLLDGPARHLDIAPWQTLLPLQDPEEMLKGVDEDNLLARFLELMSPTLTFTEYETLLDTDSQSIIEIAEHLIYWRKARLIDAVSLKCLYIPCKTSRSSMPKFIAQRSGEFELEFPEMPPLPSLLAILSSPQPFEDLCRIISLSRPLLTDALVWLLQHDLVMQVKLYLNLIVTPELKRLAYEKEEARHRRRGSSDASATTEEDEDEKETERNTSIGAGESKSKGKSRDSRDANGSGITTSSTSASLPSTSSNLDDAGSSDGAAHSADVRSPLPRSFPHNYPYISAVSSSSVARPQKSELRTRHRQTSYNRRAFLSALGAPSIIENPSELSSEEELWLAEMLDAVAAEAGSTSLATFKRMLPYLDGTHHLDEILYRAGLTRKAVRAVLKDFEDYLVTFVT